MYKHTKQQTYCCCQTKTRQLRKENRSHKSDNVLSTYFYTKQNHFLTQSFTFKSKAVLWEQNAPPTYIYPQIQQLSALYRRYFYGMDQIREPT